jgi:hypothetical protein
MAFDIVLRSPTNFNVILYEAPGPTNSKLSEFRSMTGTPGNNPRYFKIVWS